MLSKTILNILALTLTLNLITLGTAIALPRGINTVLDKLTELGTLEGKVDHELESWTGEHSAAIPLLTAIQAWGDGMQATTAATEEIKGPFHEADSKQIKDITVGMGDAMPKTFGLFTTKKQAFEEAYLREVMYYHLTGLLAKTESLARALGEKMTEKDRDVMDGVVEGVIDGYEDVIDEFEY